MDSLEHNNASWNSHTLLVLSRQLVKEVIDWALPDVKFSPQRHMVRDYHAGPADIGYILGIIETRLDRELGIWINLRRELEITELLGHDVAHFTRALHLTLVEHFQIDESAAHITRLREVI